jgi:hypothetical protein
VYTRTGTIWTQQAKLIPNNVIGTVAYFGQSVAISSDGNTAIIGGPSDDNTNRTGATWVFVRSDGQWSQQAKLLGPIEPSTTCAACHNSFKPVTAANYSPTYQGSQVGLSADGNTAIVGSPSNHYGRGSAWIYTRSNGAWNAPAAPLLASGVTDKAAQGFVSISGDGLTAVVGAPDEASAAGAAWVYANSGGAWTEQAALTASSGSLLGSSTALSYDGNTAILSFIQAGSLNNRNGAADYTRSFSSSAWTWSQPGKLVAVDILGNSDTPPPVGLSSDGNTAIVGGPGDGSNYSAPGSAWIYRRYAGSWSQLGGKMVGSGYVGITSEQGSLCPARGTRSRGEGRRTDREDSRARSPEVHRGCRWGRTESSSSPPAALP